MKGREYKRGYYKYLLLAFCLILCLGAVSYIVTGYISNLTISSCFRRLRDSAGQYAEKMRQDAEADIKLLQMAAGYAAENERGLQRAKNAGGYYAWKIRGNRLFSSSMQEYLYCAYEPVGINDWSIILGQPESLAFLDAKNVRSALYGSAILESGAFLLYLLFMGLTAKKAVNDRERELNRVQYILDVEETLFNVQRKPELIEEALQKIANKLSTQKAFFIIYDRKGNESLHVWKQGQYTVENSFANEDFPVLCSRFRKEERILYYDMKTLAGL